MENLQYSKRLSFLLLLQVFMFSASVCEILLQRSCGLNFKYLFLELFNELLTLILEEELRAHPRT